MSLYISSLNSSSNGNCYYVGNDREAILVDAGISCKEIETRMKRLELQIEKIRAIFISHEHADHIRGLTVLSKKYQLPVYITPPTMRFGRLHLDKKLIRDFKGHETIMIGELAVHAFPKFHDASDPYSFTIDCGEIKVGVFTDIGRTCEHLIKHFGKCHAAFLESNYDEEMLDKGNYPFYLKKRIRGGLGHLSNREALELFLNHRSEYMSHLLLSHLSKNNNCPELVRALFQKNCGNTEIVIASRDEETAVYQISRPEIQLSAGISRQTINSKLKSKQFEHPQLAFSF